MAIFDQRGQSVTYQYNAARNINLGVVQSREDLISELGKLRGEVDRAAAAGAIDKETATDAKSQLEKAVQQAEQSAPDKGALLDHLTAVKDLVTQVGATAGLVTGLVQAIEKVQALF